MTLIKTLDDGWSFTQLTGHDRNESKNKGTESGEWLPAKVPTGVHEELLKLSRIPDPFIGQLLVFLRRYHLIMPITVLRAK